MDDKTIDTLQANVARGSQVLPKSAQRVVKTYSVLIDIEQETGKPDAPARWKVTSAETGRVFAQAVIGLPLSVAVYKASLAATN
ncbi:MAG: hypothetical protein MK052_06200 [Alphaproteobacteria bacterium]|nr:hypothetical protein [Alphaproteobacteria bacterium]